MLSNPEHFPMIYGGVVGIARVANFTDPQLVGNRLEGSTLS